MPFEMENPLHSVPKQTNPSSACYSAGMIVLVAAWDARTAPTATKQSAPPLLDTKTRARIYALVLPLSSIVDTWA